MRLFVAIQFSPEVHEALLRAQDALRLQGKGRFTPPENLHLTLAFLGSVQTPDAAIRALQQVCVRPFPITVQGIGFFGDLCWAGARLSPELQDLQSQVARSLTKNGFSLEPRDFTPHLTLCRRYCPGKGYSPAAIEAALDSSTCMIHRVDLMESISGDGRMYYRSIFSRELR